MSALDLLTSTLLPTVLTPVEIDFKMGIVHEFKLKYMVQLSGTVKEQKEIFPIYRQNIQLILSFPG